MKTILLIEDDSIIAMDIAQALEDNGYGVDIARNGVEGLESIKQNTYDLIITNINLPRMTGEELYEEVLAINRDLARKIIFVSANKTRFVESTGNFFLAKPFDPEQLIEIVNKKNL